MNMEMHQGTEGVKTPPTTPTHTHILSNHTIPRSLYQSHTYSVLLSHPLHHTNTCTHSHTYPYTYPSIWHYTHTHTNKHTHPRS
ncbi:hypothetical protein E2C01_033393 [Portunus trituberculatus]|uniref:Uncharacterized protein n=1 Tax=Portunus trituberculatus TaxID=210409 RepID=A0A5B7F5E5_PORTR|nr:hypothetical protein [Portunus trituberculatus]